MKDLLYRGKAKNLMAFLQKSQKELQPKTEVIKIKVRDLNEYHDMSFYEQKQRFYEYATGEPRDEELENSAWGDDGHEEWVLSQD